MFYLQIYSALEMVEWCFKPCCGQVLFVGRTIDSLSNCCVVSLSITQFKQRIIITIRPSPTVHPCSNFLRLFFLSQTVIFGSYLIAHGFFNVYAMCVDTLFLCFCKYASLRTCLTWTFVQRTGRDEASCILSQKKTKKTKRKPDSHLSC